MKLHFVSYTENGYITGRSFHDHIARSMFCKTLTLSGVGRVVETFEREYERTVTYVPVQESVAKDQAEEAPAAKDATTGSQ